jgi:transposase
MTVRRHELSDAAWERLAPLLPPERPKVGRPNKAHRSVVNGILWKLRTGAPWRDLPERYGPWATVHTRFRRWRLAGVWDRVLAAVQSEADAEGKLDWSVHYLDGTVIRAHQHAAGAKGGTLRPRRSAAAKAGSARRCISRPREAVSPSPSC